jgi:hypothetical protein
LQNLAPRSHDDPLSRRPEHTADDRLGKTPASHLPARMRRDDIPGNQPPLFHDPDHRGEGRWARNQMLAGRTQPI